ncbi:MAG: MATE family efflux transporter [Lachnospiraceae bacterium]|nr:MATE family efflux transporter [Lachnospiraceae bacterium]
MPAKSMTEGAPWKHILSFSLPVMAGSLLQQLYNTVDTVIVGRFAGEAALSAVGTTGSFAFLFLAIAIGLSSGNGVVVAWHFGAGNREEVRANAATGILFLMILGVVCAFAGYFSAYPAYKYLINVPESFLDQTLIYFRIYAIGLLFQFGYNIFSAILRAVGDSAATLYFLLISSILNIALDLLFVASFQWGVAGAAIATDISQAASFVAAYIYMRRKHPIFRYRLREYRWNTKMVGRTVNVGFPISLQLILVSVGFSLIQRAVNGFGQAMTASFTVGQRVEMYLNLPCNALQTTLATYTGQNIGAGKLHRIKQGVRHTFILSFLMTALISSLVYSFAGPITGFFGLSDQAAEYCYSHVQAVALINIILCLYLPLFGVFQGSGHSGFPAVVATGALGVRLITTYLFRYSSFMGYKVIWLNGFYGLSVGFLITWTIYLSKVWQKGIGEQST